MGFDYGDTLSDGQHQRHPSLPAEVPVQQTIRFQYIHNTCMGITRMPEHCARTYAQNPKYYGSTFCCTCGGYFPVSEFVWPDNGLPINEPTD